jgi:uncharacterized protein (TIGR02646 family)
MIRLYKGAAPEILQRMALQWTNVVVGKLARGEPLTNSDRYHYAHPDIKAAVVAETHGKCAYCESKIRHVAYGDIEHVIPKSVVPQRWFDWQNLTLACDICNGNKSNFHGSHDTFVDPYAMDPVDHFWFLGATIFPKPGSDAGAITERILDLNRAELVEKRAERIRGLMKFLEVIHRTTEATLRAILEVDFQEELKDDKEYAGLSREVWRLAEAKKASSAASATNS